MRTKKELIEKHIEELRFKLLWNEASLQSLEIQQKERNKEETTDFNYQQLKAQEAQVLNDTRVTAIMLEVFQKMLQEIDNVSLKN